MAKVTLYIVNHNYGEYLEKSIESGLNQTFEDYELLVIDDGSTDCSNEILKKYESNKKIKIIRQENIGLIKTIKKIFDISESDYVVRLDADDWLDKSFLEKLVNKIEQNDKLAMVFPDYYEVDQNGNILYQIRRHDFSKNVSMLDQPAHGACSLIRRKYYNEIGGYNGFITCQDGVDIWLGLTANYPVENVREPLFYYRKHHRSLTTDEKTILQTRTKIFAAHAQKRGFVSEKTLAIIPVRDTSINGNKYALTKLADKTILDMVIEKAIGSQEVDEASCN